MSELARLIKDKQRDMIERENGLQLRASGFTRLLTRKIRSHFYTDPYILQPEITKLYAIFNQAVEVAQDIQSTLVLESGHPTRLAAVRFLEALLFQKENFWCNCYSVESVSELYRAKINFLEKLGKMINQERISPTLLDPEHRHTLLETFVGTQIAREEEVEPWIICMDYFVQNASNNTDGSEEVPDVISAQCHYLWKKMRLAVKFYAL